MQNAVEDNGDKCSSWPLGEEKESSQVG